MKFYTVHVLHFDPAVGEISVDPPILDEDQYQSLIDFCGEHRFVLITEFCEER